LDLFLSFGKVARQGRLKIPAVRTFCHFGYGPGQLFLGGVKILYFVGEQVLKRLFIGHSMFFPGDRVARPF
jgi:hypothetical protein